MTAILLAAGVGVRMGQGAGPKCLLSIGGRSLLQRTLESLRASGVGEVILVVGYGKGQVIREASRYAGRMKLVCIENPQFQKGAILSLWAAEKYLDREILVMDTDVLFPPAVLERLVRSRHRNCILVDGSVTDTGEEQMVFGQGARVHHITKTPSEPIRSRFERFGESLGFLKLSCEAAGKLRTLLSKKIESGVHTIEHEQLYPALFEQVEVGAERVDWFPWTEIDTPADLKRAESQVYPRWSVPLCLNRWFSHLFLPWVVKLPVTPNQWTWVSFMLGMASIGLMAQGSSPAILWAALLFHLFYIVDNWDGDVARIKGLSSWWGGWWDVSVDAMVQVALPLGLALGVARMGGPDWILIVGGAAALGLALDMAVTSWAKLLGFGPSVFSDSTRRPSGSNLKRWIQLNLTHENFSLVVVLMLVLDWRVPFLLLIAIGSHCFWIGYLWRQRERLWA